MLWIMVQDLKVGDEVTLVVNQNPSIISSMVVRRIDDDRKEALCNFLFHEGSGKIGRGTARFAINDLEKISSYLFR